MKTTIKNFTLLLLLSLSLFACSDSDGPLIGTSDWKFTVTSTTSTSPSVTGYPQTTSTSITKNGLTTKEANDVVTSLTSTTTTSQYIAGYGTLTVTVKSTCTKTQI